MQPAVKSVNVDYYNYINPVLHLAIEICSKDLLVRDTFMEASNNPRLKDNNELAQHRAVPRGKLGLYTI